MDKVAPWKSKTLWMSLLVAVGAFVPPVAEWMKANPELFGLVLGGIFAALRLITKGRIAIE